MLGAVSGQKAGVSQILLSDSLSDLARLCLSHCFQKALVDGMVSL